MIARRHDRPSRFLLIAGSVDAVLGSVTLHLPLLILGVALMGTGVALRLRRPQRAIAYPAIPLHPAAPPS
ncbi:MAG: hypothetical protein IGR80_10450 [Synechococcales cyanobacterium K44_A2020_017]|nr:hypothetical protein [Synechococcales cyanobacterium K32_A2020_035]MBF2095162.1 hypothetical protein [Synechococcales cyanobacterium K44_A2020_017]